MQILAISGSLRKKSSNTLLILESQHLAPTNTEINLFDGIEHLPYYNPDLDGDVIPLSVQEFRQSIAHADALLISTPEYAHGIPGVLKNSLDWLVSDPQFPGKPISIFMGSASEGSFALEALIEVLTTMSAKVIHESIVCIPGLRTKFDSSGKLKDVKTKEILASALKALVAKVKQ